MDLNKINPDYDHDSRALGMATFWTVQMYLKDIEESEVEKQTGSGWSNGVLKQDLGPVKAGTTVALANRLNTVTVLVCNTETDGWDILYEFEAIIQAPLFTEKKQKI